MFALLSYYLADLVFTQAQTETFPRLRNMRPKHITEAKLMQPKVVAHSVLAVMLLAGCDVVPEGTKTLDPSGLTVRTEAIVYNTNERDVAWASTDNHPCTGDVISISGSSHWVIHTGFDSNGALHYNATIVSKGEGLGTSTKVYKINEHFKEVDQVPGNYTSYVFREEMRLKVDGPGTADDYYKTTVVKVTVNANGEPTVMVDSESSSCT
jgi:hypothetical protein